MAVKIAVTGGSGFIGREVVRQANESGHEAWSFDRSDGNDILGSLDGLSGAEAVIHLAGVLGTHELFEDPEKAVGVNVIGSLRIMQWCIENNARYVQISMPDVFPSIYTATKVSAQRLAGALAHSRGLNYANVIVYNVFGPGQAFGPGHPQKIVPTFALAGWRKEPMPIWGDGSQVVDLIHVRDTATALLRAAHSETPGETIYAGSGQAISVIQLARMIADYTGSRAGMLLLPMRDGETPTKTLRSHVSFAPFRLSDLEETIEWYRQHA